MCEHLGTRCWVWTGALSGNHAIPGSGGYGQLWVNPKVVYAHRFSYELHVGQLAPGEQPDHLCFNRPCVNPFHLRAVTQRRNMENRQGATRASRSGVRGVCWDPHGKRWRATIWQNRIRVYQKYFHDLAEAAAAVTAKRAEIFE